MFYSKSDFNTTPGDYKIHTYDKIHEYNHVHEYNKIHEYSYSIPKYNRIHTYEKVREYKYKEYKPTQIERLKPKPKIRRHPPEQPRSRRKKSKSNLTWPDKPIYVHTYRPYQYIPPPKLREYEYKEYTGDNSNYMNKQIIMYNGWTEYKLTPENYPPFRYLRKTRKIDHYDKENTINSETSLKDVKLNDDTTEFQDDIPEPLLVEEDVVPGVIVGPTVFQDKPSTPLQQNESQNPNQPVIQTVALASNIKDESPIHRSSPHSVNSIYTPIGSRSPTPNLPPVVVTGGLIGAAVVNDNHNHETKDKIDSENQPTAKSKPNSPNVIQGAAVATVASDSIEKTLTQPKEPTTPKSSSPIRHTPYENTEIVAVAVLGGTISQKVATDNKEKQSTEPLQSQQSTAKPESHISSPSPNVVPIVATAAAVKTSTPKSPEPQTETDNKELSRSSEAQQSPPTSPVSFKAPVVIPVVATATTENASAPQSTKEAEPKQNESQQLSESPVLSSGPSLVPVVASAAEGNTSAPKPSEESTPKQSSEEVIPPSKQTPEEVIPPSKPTVAAVAVASVPVTSTNNPSNNIQYKEEPSSWSPVPDVNNNNGSHLPPEVVATIEAYDKAHDI